MTLELISLLDESGITVASFPRIDKDSLLGSLVTAVNEAIKALTSSEVETLEAGDKTIFMEKLQGKYSLLIVIKKDHEWFFERESVEWFTSVMGEEIADALKVGSIDIGLDVSLELSPLLKKYFELYNEISESLINLSKLFKLALKIVGEKTLDLFKNCEAMGLKFIFKNDNVYLGSVHLKLDRIPNVLETCKNRIKGFIKNTL